MACEQLPLTCPREVRELWGNVNTMRMFTCVPGGLPCCEMEKVLEFDLPVLEAIDKRRVALQRTHVHSLLRITRIDRRHNQMHLAGCIALPVLLLLKVSRVSRVSVKQFQDNHHIAVLNGHSS
eukprot:1097637-Prorocentrum_minimum.AAC.3